MGSVLVRLRGGCAAQRCGALRSHVPVPHRVPHVVAAEEGGVVPVRVLEATHVLLTRKGGRALTRPQVCLAQVNRLTYTPLFVSITWLRFTCDEKQYVASCMHSTSARHLSSSLNILLYITLPHLISSNHVHLY